MKGSAHLDWVLGLIIFLFGFILAISYVKQSMSIEFPKEKIIASALEELEKELEKISIKVNVYKVATPEICVQNYPCEFKVKNLTNISVLNSTNNLQLVSYENGNLRMLVNWCERIKVVEVNESVIYPEGDAWITENSLGNGDLNITYNSTHIIEMKYKQKEFLIEPVNLTTTEIKKRKSDSTQAKVVFDNLNLSVDSFSPRIWFFSQPKNITLNLKFFEKCYIGNTLYNCSSLTSIAKLSNLTALYNSSIGIAFIGNNLNVSLENNFNQSIAIALENVEKFEIYFIKGNYTLAINESKAFNYACKLMPYITYNPISYQKLSSQGISLENFNYRIEIENLTFGEPIPLLTDIYRKELYMLIFNQGILNTTKLELWVWK